MSNKRRHDNLIYGYGCLDQSRPLDYGHALSPRVHARPSNIRQIVSFWGRLKAAWLVFSMNAVAVRWYDEENAHQWGNTWWENPE